MDIQHLKSLLDACSTAKHVIETLPELPKGMKPRHIHVLDQIGMVCEGNGECRVSDVSDGLNITMPSVTKLVQELESMHLVEKCSDQEDKRVTLLKLTSQGEAYVRKYVYDFQSKWTESLSFVPNEETEKAIRLIEQLAQAMPNK